MHSGNPVGSVTVQDLTICDGRQRAGVRSASGRRGQSRSDCDSRILRPLLGRLPRLQRALLWHAQVGPRWRTSTDRRLQSLEKDVGTSRDSARPLVRRLRQSNRPHAPVPTGLAPIAKTGRHESPNAWPGLRSHRAPPGMGTLDVVHPQHHCGPCRHDRAPGHYRPGAQS